MEDATGFDSAGFEEDVAGLDCGVEDALGLLDAGLLEDVL